MWGCFDLNHYMRSDIEPSISSIIQKVSGFEAFWISDLGIRDVSLIIKGNIKQVNMNRKEVEERDIQAW